MSYCALSLAEAQAVREAYAAGEAVEAIARRMHRQRRTILRELALQPPSLADEIEAARREAASAPLYRPGGRL